VTAKSDRGGGRRCVREREGNDEVTIMSRFTVVMAFGLLACLVVSGCSSPSEERPVAQAEQEPLDEETAAAARTRGVARNPGENKAAEAKPQVVLSALTYEWRNVPERGIMVTMDFTNPANSYERARGHVFLVAESTLSGSHTMGVYPWNTTIGDNGLPDDYTDGTHLLYRDQQQVRGFIPYEPSDGHWETLRLFVFHEDGRLLVNRTYDLEITGEPNVKRTVNPGFDL
jgi:hypothetical protein